MIVNIILTLPKIWLKSLNTQYPDNLIIKDFNQSNNLGKSLPHSENNSTDCLNSISSIRKQNTKNIVMGHLNITSLQNKFELIKEVSFHNIEVFFLNKTKLNETFMSNYI